MECGEISKLLNSFGGVIMPAEAAECIREYFCANISDTDEDESDTGEDDNDTNEPVVSMSDVSPSPTATSSTPADAIMTSVAPAATFDRPLICSSLPDPLHSTVKSRRILAQRRGSRR